MLFSKGSKLLLCLNLDLTYLSIGSLSASDFNLGSIIPSSCLLVRILGSMLERLLPLAFLPTFDIL